MVESEMKLKLLVREKGVRVLSEEETKPTMAMELLAAKLRRVAEKIEGTRGVAMVFLLETRKSFLALGESGTVKTKTLLSIPSLILWPKRSKTLNCLLLNDRQCFVV